ncbi:hypothetical protein LUW75_10800 [Streptomyces sp. MRC013]|uniref:hypothetical protein n=1 Tax=Streptomyces sp. MRC013 TaxID=2898276 RepID=UPI002026A518|nr:hypothetical protein [Streptomyces sp. MRC013]URM90402.1 hypothetical protein LUW75_10800 [Streptomyces sp. MRC013]
MTIATLGGVTIGLAILTATLIRWWPGLKSLQTNPLGSAAGLLPFLGGWAYGALAILSLAGIVGWIADGVLWISNWLGDVAIVWGVGGTTGPAGRATYQPLTGTGVALMVILTVAVIVAAKKSTRGRDIKAGAWCGICLGTSAGVAGAAAVPLAQAVNWAGGALYGAVG